MIDARGDGIDGKRFAIFCIAPARSVSLKESQDQLNTADRRSILGVIDVAMREHAVHFVP
jgi:hypothetical protein